MLACQIAVVGADGVGGGDGVVGQLVVLRDLAHQRGGGLPAGQLFAQEGVEHRAAGVQRLELVLHIQRREDILRIAHRQVAGVGVVGRCALVGGDDIGIALLVVLGQTVGGGLGGGGLQIVEVAVLLLIVAEPLAHMVEDADGEILRLLVGQILPQPRGVQTGLVHAHQTDGGEVVVEAAQIPLGVGVQPLVHQAADGGALDLQAPRRHIHHVVKAGEELRLIPGEVGDTGQVDGHHAHRAGGLAAAEEAAALFPQLPQVQPQTAAHGADIAGLHVGVDVVGEVGRAEFGGHLKEQAVVLRLTPVEVLGDGVGGDGVLEAAAVGVALDHDLNERPVDHVHLRLTVAVGKVHGLAAHDAGLVG